ncbi:type VI secretion system baseplate subunit TssF [Oceanimonas sp. CHS3-5]|uniref:type VI secretion system baseplate subunit TssF n=1 Tax=Oceanimonas sp. CHS3-5 TaxID=3068186 RepID=UPI00273FB051|nr:type VI secretion system baseplate subunit TssF [Oceanimonas sp. CHS3-5]MDP5291710.1 type VI secretion system baseplate subunit TssF [Oceanimonas sp. CHS3-5]
MSLNRYFQDELQALREQGKAFSERNPALAPFLGHEGRDPDVERLLEGFAFLTGRLRQRLDDELPELSHSLLQLLWPNYLQPIPAFTMLEFEPLTDIVSAQRVPRNTEVESKPRQGVSCRFRTCYHTRLYPLRHERLEFAPAGDGGVLTLHLQLEPHATLPDMQLDSLRLHLAGDRLVSSALYLSLLEYLEQAELRLFDEQNELLHQYALGKQCISPAGFDDDQALLPYSLNTFSGYRHLQEYFCFPEKLMFVDVGGLDVTRHNSPAHQACRRLELRLTLSRLPLARFTPHRDQIRLYCTPAINLFEHDAVPIRMDHRQTQYRLLPAALPPEYSSVVSVKRVHGWQPGGRNAREYSPFESFEHSDYTNTPYYGVHRKPGLDSRKLETWLSFHQPGLELHAETISIELLCCNQDLPSELNTGDICVSTDTTPGFAHFKNIRPATKCYPPPMHRESLWRLISNMSLNYISLTNLDALRVVLETYDFCAPFDEAAARRTRHMLAGIKAIDHQRTDRLWQGLPVRGIHTRLTLASEHFSGPGELYLFGAVLNEFFALYASINAFHELSINTTDGARFTWTPRMGQQPIL